MGMKHQAHGFTAVELLVVMAITAILLATAVPSIREHLQNQNMRAAVVALQASLLLARNQAVHGRQATVVCPASPAEGCGSGEQWSQGWWAFADPNGDRTRQADEPLVQQSGPLEGVQVRSSSARTPATLQTQRHGAGQQRHAAVLRQPRAAGGPATENLQQRPGNAPGSGWRSRCRLRIRRAIEQNLPLTHLPKLRRIPRLIPR